MKKKVNVLFLLLLVSVASLSAQTVDTIEVYSPKMKKTIKNVVILPSNYEKTDEVRYPVIYLLHGYGGRYDSWVKHIKKNLAEEANKQNVIVVCPEGENSWYWDSSVNLASQFETYISSELVKHIDSHYKTIASANGRAISGLSMGGHGALWLGINHPDTFGACGSMSGGVDIRPFPNNWDMKKQLGSYKNNANIWDTHTVMNILDRVEPNTLAIIIDCGTEDFFYGVNEKLHKELLCRNIAHDFIVRPGAHNAAYWENAFDYQLLLFSKFFNKYK